MSDKAKEGPMGWVDVLVTPLMVAIVGALATYYVTTYQTQSAKIAAAADRDAAAKRDQTDRDHADQAAKQERDSQERRDAQERRLKAVDILIGKVTSKDARERQVALTVLGVLDPEMMAAVKKLLPEDQDLQAAVSAVGVAKPVRTGAERAAAAPAPPPPTCEASLGQIAQAVRATRLPPESSDWAGGKSIQVSASVDEAGNPVIGYAGGNSQALAFVRQRVEQVPKTDGPCAPRVVSLSW